KQRREAALVEPGIAEEGGKAGGEEVERHAGDRLVALEVDRGQAMHRRKCKRREDAEEQPYPGRTEHRRRGGRAEGRNQALAFEPDVDDAGALGIEAGEAREDDRHREPDGRGERVDEVEIEVHRRARPSLAKMPCSGSRSMSPMAPVNRITIAWMVRIIS